MEDGGIDGGVGGNSLWSLYRGIRGNPRFKT